LNYLDYPTGVYLAAVPEMKLLRPSHQRRQWKFGLLRLQRLTVTVYILCTPKL